MIAVAGFLDKGLLDGTLCVAGVADVLGAGVADVLGGVAGVVVAAAGRGVAADCETVEKLCRMGWQPEEPENSAGESEALVCALK
jgi:hypothetical protein